MSKVAQTNRLKQAGIFRKTVVYATVVTSFWQKNINTQCMNEFRSTRLMPYEKEKSKRSQNTTMMTANCRTVASVVMRTLIFSREMHALNQLLKDVWDEMAIFNGLGRPKRDKA